MAYNYTKEEINALVASLNSRINTVSGSCDTVGGNISSHLTDPNAHNAIISPKENSSRVDGLADRVNALASRVNTLAMHAGLNGTTSYSAVGEVGYDNVDIHFDINASGAEPLTYHIYSGSLLEGLTLDSNAGSITGYPRESGESNLVILGVSGVHAILIHVNITFTWYLDSFNKLISDLRSGNISDADLGTEYTIMFPKISDDSEYGFFGRGSGEDEYSFINNGYRYESVGVDDNASISSIQKMPWLRYNIANYTGSETVYTDDLIIMAGTLIKDASGNVVDVVTQPASFLREHRLILTSLDTDVPSSGNYNHTARLEFLDGVGLFQTKNSSGMRNFVSKNRFMARVPLAIRNVVVPVMTNLNLFFLPSLYEQAGIETVSDWTGSSTVTFAKGNHVQSKYYVGSSLPNPNLIRYKISDDGSRAAESALLRNEVNSIYPFVYRGTGQIYFESGANNMSTKYQLQAPAFVVG